MRFGTGPKDYPWLPPGREKPILFVFDWDQDTLHNFSSEEELIRFMDEDPDEYAREGNWVLVLYQHDNDTDNPFELVKHFADWFYAGEVQ